MEQTARSSDLSSMRSEDGLCPNCAIPLEIAAIDLSVLGSVVLFVCPSCGLTKAEDRAEARRKLRARINELDRLMAKLKNMIGRP
jgi:hypothetical protein